MSQSFAEALSRVAMSRTLGDTFRRAHDYAHQQAHRRLSLEHLVLALCEDQDAALVLQACNVDIQRLATDASGYIGRIEDRLQPGEQPETSVDPDLLKILEYAAAAAHQSRRREINGAIVLAAIVGEGRSPAAQMLRSQGLTFEETIKALQRATVAARQQPPAPRPPVEAPAPLRVQPPRQGSGGATPSAEEILASVRERINSGRTQPPASRQPPPSPPVQEQPPPAESAYDSYAEQEAPPAYDTRPVPRPGPPPQLAPPPSSAPAHAPMGGAPAGHAPQPQYAQRPQLGPPPPLPPQPHPQAQPGSGWGPPPQQPAYQQDLRRAPPLRPPAALPPLTPSPPQAPEGQQPRRADAAVAPPWPEPGQPARTRQPQAAEPGRQGSQLPVPVGRNAVDLGQLIENVPRFMRVGVPEIVEVRIARADLQGIAVGMEGRGTAFRHDLVVTRAMSVKLRAPDGGMWIETASPETQWIESRPGLMSDDFASWRWTVLPERRGRTRLQLVASARTVGTDGLAAETALPDQMIDVRIGVNFGRVAARWGGWAVAAMAGGVLAKFGEDAVRIGLKLIASGG